MIQIKDLAFSYGKKMVLSNISMTLEEGRIYGLLGENGVGKTTLLNLLSGIKAPLCGSIDADSYKPYDRKPGFLSQLYFLPDESHKEYMSAYDYARGYGAFWPCFDMGKFLDLMRIFEMDTQQRMDQMSTGQLKKTWLSFAIACQTKYLFLDEPTNGLDIPSKAQFRKAVTGFTREDSIVVISTHQVKDLENIIDPIIILDTREVLMNATIDEIESKLYFDYGNELLPEALYREMIPGGMIQVAVNSGRESGRVNIEALFNTVHQCKELIKELFNK